MTAGSDDAAALFERYRITVAPDGVEIATYRWQPEGGASGPPVLLVHGWGSRATHLGAIVKVLNRAGRACLSFDAPAHGDSPGSVTSMPQVIRCIRAVVAAYGPVDTVVGHSFGGMAVGLAFAERPEPGDPLVAGALALIAAPSTIDSMTRRFLLAEGLPLDRMDGLHRVLKSDFGYDAADFDLVRIADRLPAKLLIAHDEGDPEVPFADAERLAAARPDAEFVRTDRFGHLRILFCRPVLTALSAFVGS